MYDIFIFFIKHLLINVTWFLLSVSLSSFIIITLIILVILIVLVFWMFFFISFWMKCNTSCLYEIAAKWL